MPAPVAERKKMIEPTAKLSVSRQAIMLGISRGSIDYQSRPVVGRDPEADAPHRQATHGVPVDVS